MLTSLPSIRIWPEDDVLEPGDQSQQRRLAAAGRSDEHGELAVVDLEADVVDDLDLAEILADLLEFDAAHVGNLHSGPEAYFTAPNVKPRTSCFCENQPRMRMGAIASTDAAESSAQKSPSGGRERGDHIGQWRRV